MNCVANLPAGVVFGEKGLDENVRRNATCICNQDTHFGIIYKNDYVKVLKEVSRLQTQRNKEFVFDKVFSRSIDPMVAEKLAFHFF